jgi:2-polyprenyl-3-methyl-5-hydroxy-6-metoxy-1,4-benzoquinol methylase
MSPKRQKENVTMETAVISKTIHPDKIDRTQIDALQERMIDSAKGVFISFSIYLGHKLGYYRILAENRGLTSTVLALKAQTHERYTREWLEQQATAGIIDVVDATRDALQRQFCLPEAHVEVLVKETSVDYMAPLSELLLGVTRPMRALLDCYRHGGGVAFADYGSDMRNGQAGLNRMMFLTELTNKWTEAIPGLHNRLNTPGARVMDFGCGCGWSSIGIARAYPNVQVHAYDLDRLSVESARQNAKAYGVDDRIVFHCEDVTTVEETAQVDFFLCCETLHDLADPVGALRTARQHLKSTGVAMIVDERVADSFMGEDSEMDEMMYGWSILHCLPAGMADGAEHHCGGTGTVMRMPTLKRYAREAGFADVERLAIENLFFSVYQLTGNARSEGGMKWNR